MMPGQKINRLNIKGIFGLPAMFISHFCPAYFAARERLAPYA
jgi:hypothetical protein